MPEETWRQCWRSSPAIWRGPELMGQILICPVTAYTPDTPSYSTNGTGFGFEASFMPWMWDHYLTSPRQGQDYRVAVLRTTDLSHVAPALVITAGTTCSATRESSWRTGCAKGRGAHAGDPLQWNDRRVLRLPGTRPGSRDTLIDEIAGTLRRWSVA